MTLRTALLSLGSALVLWGCTTVLGIDDNYVDDQPTKGGTGGNVSASGGAGGAPTETGGGGAAEQGGSGGTAGGCGNNAPCADGEKCCTGANGVDTACTLPKPDVGCSLTSCERCPPPPANAAPVCNGEQCDIRCNDNYVRNGDQCDPSGAGGRGGTGGTGAGGKPACDAAKCPGPGGKACTIFSPLNCCKSDGTCGCSWATTGQQSAYCL